MANEGAGASEFYQKNQRVTVISSAEAVYSTASMMIPIGDATHPKFYRAHAFKTHKKLLSQVNRFKDRDNHRDSYLNLECEVLVSFIFEESDDQTQKDFSSDRTEVFSDLMKQLGTTHQCFQRNAS